MSNTIRNTLFNLFARTRSSRFSHNNFLLLLNLHLLARALTGTRIGSCTLTTQRKTLTMTNPSITTQIHQSLDVHGYFTAKITLDRKFGYCFA